MPKSRNEIRLYPAANEGLSCHPAVPKGVLGQAIGYMLANWKKTDYLHRDRQLRPDNNLVENAIRPFVVGRKNWLFAGSPVGAATSATFFSLIENAKANGLEPYGYLRHIF